MNVFERRLKSIPIKFMKFGTSANMPSGYKLKNGDSIKLKYDHYDIDVCKISFTSEESITGVVDSISDSNSGNEVDGIGNSLNIQIGTNVQFKEKNIFHCTCMP